MPDLLRIGDELHALRRGAVHPRLRLGQALEDARGHVPHRRRQAASLQDVEDLVEQAFMVGLVRVVAVVAQRRRLIDRLAEPLDPVRDLAVRLDGGSRHCTVAVRAR